MPEKLTISIFTQGAWVPAATVARLGGNRCIFSYLDEYIWGQKNPLPVALGMPINGGEECWIEGLTGPEPDRRPPPFLYDLVPQGLGRKHLIRQLGLADGDDVVLPLIAAGAFNPIGCLRIDTAMNFFERQSMANPDFRGAKGFSLDEVLHPDEDFLEHMLLHGMLATGTTGVQGVAPKFLLRTNADGLWFADMALPDHLATGHWLIKLPRGRTEADLSVLHNEAAYMRLAKACGLATHSESILRDNKLFLPRFDRFIRPDGSLEHLYQESLASIAGLRGFGMNTSQQHLLKALRSVSTNPFRETIEFIKRDILNQAMRNTDNHARNTAVQRTHDGTIQLTPLFDFAPMFLDPDLIVRSNHWRDKNGRRQDSWNEIISSLEIGDGEKHAVIQELKAFSNTVASLPALSTMAGINDSIIKKCLNSIEQQFNQLARL